MPLDPGQQTVGVSVTVVRGADLTLTRPHCGACTSPAAGRALALGAHTPQDAPDRLGRALRRGDEPPHPRSGEQSEETADLVEFLEPVGRLIIGCHANTLPFAALGMDGICTTGTRSRAR